MKGKSWGYIVHSKQKHEQIEGDFPVSQPSSAQ